MNILLVDNRDSFTYNLVHWVAQCGRRMPDIVRYDEFDAAVLSCYDLLIVSAGPGHPQEYAKYLPVVSQPTIPVLGICLGMQIINTVFGGTVGPFDSCIHGQTDTVIVDGELLRVARYHSLCVQEIGLGLEPLWINNENIPMGIKHCEKPILGYQFHPESFLTEKPEVFFEYAMREICSPDACSLSGCIG